MGDSRNRSRGTENPKREWETEILRQKEKEAGHFELHRECDTETVRDKDRSRGTYKLKREC